MNRTPTFFINGVQHGGFFSLPALLQAIEDAPTEEATSASPLTSFGDVPAPDVADDKVAEASWESFPASDAPGFVDAHIHVESTFVTPAAFAWLTLPRGTTTVLADPHKIVNVAGKDGLRWKIEAGRGTLQTILYGVPACVPALPGFETAGATLGPEDVSELLEWPGVIGLAEVMDYRAVVAGEARMRGVVAAARARGRLIDGHCPGLTGADLSAYLAAGVDSDHTKNSVDVSLEKARLGMLLQLQEKSSGRS